MITWPTKAEIDAASESDLNHWYWGLPHPTTPMQRNVIGWIKFKLEEIKDGKADSGS